MRRTVLRSLLLGAALLGLNGCATAPAARSALAVAPYRAALELTGRIAINYSKDGKSESLSGKFSWQQSAQQTEVSLISPTGQTVAVISLAPGTATLTQSGKPPRSAADLDSLMRETLGWSLPVSGLREWLQGHAISADGQPFAASPARDSVVTRDGWKLDYLSWQDNPAALPQPKRLDLTRLTRGDVDEMAIRIVLDPTVTD
ncbi:MAG: lipoprotein insertase outer membrane protein LolB [Sphingomonadaceae bacterium]